MQNQIVPDIVDLQDLWDPYKIHCWDMILDHFKKEYNILFLYIYIYFYLWGLRPTAGQQEVQWQAEGQRGKTCGCCCCCCGGGGCLC